MTPYQRPHRGFETLCETNYAGQSRGEVSPIRFKAAREILGVSSSSNSNILQCSEKFVCNTPSRDPSTLRERASTKNATPISYGQPSSEGWDRDVRENESESAYNFAPK